MAGDIVSSTDAAPLEDGPPTPSSSTGAAAPEVGPPAPSDVLSSTSTSSTSGESPLKSSLKRKCPFPCSRVAAPMVNQSDLPFRLLVRNHGASCAYSEMLYSQSVAEDETYKYLKSALVTCKEDRPLVVQLCGNDPTVMAAAAKRLVSYTGGALDGIDVNLGCPQSRAQEGHYGAYLLGKKDRPTVVAIVKAMTAAVDVPITCKIRLCEDTVELAKQLEEAGCKLLAVHGRQRGSDKKRRAGPADLDAVREIREAVTIPVLSNGNVESREDVSTAVLKTNAEGIMCAEGLLRNPAIFDSLGCGGTDLGEIAMEYFDLVEDHGTGDMVNIARAHLRWILGKSGHGRTIRFDYLGSYAKHVQLARALEAATTLDELRDIAIDCLSRKMV